MFRKFSRDLCCVRGKHLLRKCTDTELQNHTTGPTHGPPTPIHTNPQHLNDVVAPRYHRIKTLFFPERSVSSMHLQPAPQVGIQHQGHSPTTASQRTPALSSWRAGCTESCEYKQCVRQPCPGLFLSGCHCHPHPVSTRETVNPTADV